MREKNRGEGVIDLTQSIECFLGVRFRTHVRFRTLMECFLGVGCSGGNGQKGQCFVQSVKSAVS